MPVIATAQQTPSLSHVFNSLLVDIVSGRHASGVRLPAERELALSLGASRPTVREAIKRLGELKLIEVRRGSGILVRARDDWSFGVLPAYLRHGPGGRTPQALSRLVRDLLALRQSLFVNMLRFVGERLTPGSLGAARQAVRDAWAQRADHGAFLRLDFRVLRTVASSADFSPAVWLLNDFWDVYHELAGAISQSANVPDDYVDTYDATFDALEQGNLDSACRRMTAYFERHDRRLLSALGILS